MRKDKPTMERIILATTQLNISGKIVDVTLIRNEYGVLERIIEDEELHFPEGTCLEGYGEEIWIYEYKN